MEPIYSLQELCFLNNILLKGNILKLYIPKNFLTNGDLKKVIDLEIKNNKNKIVGDDCFYDSGHENIVESLIELKKSLFCDIKELPLLLDGEFSNIVKWRLEIGK